MTRFITTFRTRAFRELALLLLATLALLSCDLFDIFPPDVEIVSPKEDISYFATLPCSLRVTDNRKIEKVELFLDGESIHEFTKEPYKTDIGLDQVNVSSVTLKAVAHDKAGNYTEASREVSLSLGFKLTSPNGGETWPEKSTQTITWESSGNIDSTVNLHYSIDGGSSWNEIIGSTTNNGTCTWILPNFTDAHTACRVKVAGTTSGFADTSDTDFAIEDIPFSDQVQKLLAADAQADDGLGFSVALSSDYALAGAWREDTGGNEAGAAYVFHRTGLNSWDDGIKLVAPDAAADDWLGISVALSGDYAIVGAYGEDTGGDAAGAAYVFQRIGANSWDGGTKLLASDAQAGDGFGWSVALSDDYAIVGATREDTRGDAAGAAYVFHRDGANSWDSGTKLLAADAQAGDRFGFSVALNGDYALVGAPYNDTGGDNAGVAYAFFQRTGAGSWDGGTKLVSADAGADDRFGFSVALGGDYALVGVPKEDTGGNEAGAVYVFEITGPGSWDGGTKLLADDAGTDDRFGQAVALSGDYALVGAPYNPAGGYAAGAAYIFQRTGPGSWDGGTKIVAVDAQDYDWFGYSVAISGDCALVGADGEDAGGNYAGAAYIFK